MDEMSTKKTWPPGSIYICAKWRCVDLVDSVRGHFEAHR
jgi:hypothetical protein